MSCRFRCLDVRPSVAGAEWRRPTLQTADKNGPRWISEQVDPAFEAPLGETSVHEGDERAPPGLSVGLNKQRAVG